MKTELKILKLIVFFIAVAILSVFTNCNDKPCPYESGYETHHYPLNADTSKIPYSGFDSLVFLRITPSDTDTIVYKGNGKQYFDERKYEYNENSICDDEYVYDGYVINFTSDQSPDNIWFKILMFTDLSSEFFIKYKGREFHDFPDRIFDNKSYAGYSHSKSFEGMVFYDISELVRAYSGNDEQLYLSPNNGIVRFELKDFVLQLLK